MADPRGENNPHGGYANRNTGAGGYNNPSGGRDANDRGNGDGAARAAAQEAARQNAVIAQREEAARVEQARSQAAIAAAQAQAAMAAARRPQEQNTRAAAPTVFQRSSPAVPSMNPNQVNQPYYSPYQDQPTMFQNAGLPFGGMAGRFGEELGQDNYFGGLLSAYGQINPLGSIANQTTYGMNDQARQEYLRQESTNPDWDRMSEADRVSLARKPQLDNQLPNAYIGGGQGRPNEAQLNAMRPENISESQWAGLPMEMKSSLAQSSGMMGGGGGGNMMNSFVGGQLPDIGMGTGRDYQPTGGTFKPITFRSGTGNSDPYAGLSDMAQQGQGMFNVAGQDALQSADQFNYNFDPQAAGQRLFNERSSLLEPAFAQQRAQNLEQMQGLGRIGLQLSGEGLGAGENSGMMNPDMFGMNAAQSQALAGLSAQSTQDAFGQEVQRAGLDLSQFNTNQVTDQQRYANLMGTGQSMLTGSMIEPQMRAELLTQGRQQQALDQNYELGRYNADTARITGQAQANQANYQPDPWLSAGVGLGTSFLGTDAGSGWLSGVGGDIWDFFT